jgi:hypothetical protein
MEFRWFQRICAVCLGTLMFLAACSGNYEVRDSSALASSSKIFISAFEGDEHDIHSRLEFKFADLGYVIVKNSNDADLFVNWRYTGGAFDTNASLFIVDKQGHTVYSGEGGNPGWGTALDRAGAIWGCFERALAGLRRK